MNSQGLIQKFNYCIKQLSQSNEELIVLALKKAICDKAYRIKQAEEILKLNGEKCPDGLIMELVKNNKQVEELRFQKELAEKAYITCIKSMQNLRVEAEAIRSNLKEIKVEQIN